MGSSSSSPILGQFEKSVAAATGGANRMAADKETFLKLLITQLKHQDPLNPAEDKEFITQLAQFTSLEELQKINSGVGKLNESQAQQQVINAVNLVGMAVSAQGYQITKMDDYVSLVIADVPESIDKGTINVYSLREDGSRGMLVFSEKLGPRAAGEATYTWSGKDNQGRDLPNGSYEISITGQTDRGKEVQIKTKSDGTVIGVKTSPDGNHFLYLADGRTVRFNNIELVSRPRQADPEDKEKDKKKPEEGTPPDNTEET